MKNTTLTLILLLVSVAGAFGQSSDDAAVRKFIADYDNAYRMSDPSFLEKNLAPEYSVTNLGTRRDRAKTIADAQKEKAAPTEKLVDFRSVVDSVRIEGATAVVSGSYVWKGSAANDPNAVVHVDNGRFTMVFAKRGDRWLLTDEHYSDGPHDGKMLEEQVLQAGLRYAEVIKSGDVKAYEKFLAEDFAFTNERGELISRADDIRHFAERKVKIESTETLDHKARWIGGSTVLETGIFRVGLVEPDGKKSIETGRFTTVWQYRSNRWQIVSDHVTGIAAK